MARKKKVVTKKTEIIAVLDRSGSMSSIINDAIGGFNTFLEEQKAVPGEARMTLVQFDDQYEVVYQAKPIVDVQPLTTATYHPRGMTALLDAVGKTIQTQKARIDAEGWADNIVLVVTSDGEENASREYTNATVTALVTAAEAAGWGIIYAGANQDALQVAKSFGIVRNSANVASYQATSDGMRSVFTHTSALTSASRA